MFLNPFTHKNILFVLRQHRLLCPTLCFIIDLLLRHSIILLFHNSTDRKVEIILLHIINPFTHRNISHILCQRHLFCHTFSLNLALLFHRTPILLLHDSTDRNGGMLSLTFLFPSISRHCYHFRNCSFSRTLLPL